MLHDDMHTLRMCVCRKYDFGIGILLLLCLSVLSNVSFSSLRAEHGNRKGVKTIDVHKKYSRQDAVK